MESKSFTLQKGNGKVIHTAQVVTSKSLEYNKLKKFIHKSNQNINQLMYSESQIKFSYAWVSSNPIGNKSRDMQDYFYASYMSYEVFGLNS